MPKYRITVLTDSPTTTRGKLMQQALEANDPATLALLHELGLPKLSDTRVLEDWQYISKSEPSIIEIKAFIATLPGNTELRGWAAI